MFSTIDYRFLAFRTMVDLVLPLKLTQNKVTLTKKILCRFNFAVY